MSSIRTIVDDNLPWSDQVTTYDRTHHNIYIRLIDAREDGATMEEMSRVVLAIDPEKEPERAMKVLMAHLKRATWMVATGWRQLLTS